MYTGADRYIKQYSNTPQTEGHDITVGQSMRYCYYYSVL